MLKAKIESLNPNFALKLPGKLLLCSVERMLK